ncbi:transporter substrate-binding domain-containing protein [Salicibibacter cibarius]|uniref:Transporter substrate-binding domain-containing protein n=1 Tax=Salicibibacter cibarius TaxID=2743000 RepID=A0A7T6Z0C8_9BACI|nr:GntR family transcriptional regulator YhfZ [Salicibibacter cibarius]QQK74656.1 transporter substrate-binding domain-containing protein [Salicibibacter cibarius]
MNGSWAKLYSKNGLAAKQIAGKLVYLEVGQRIPRVIDFVHEFSMGRGTVQDALKLLEEMKAVHLEAKGHLGTFILKMDTQKLLEIAGIGPLIGVMPLPYSRKYEGLATGLVEGFEHQHIRANLAYMRGAAQRVDALKSGRYDFVLLSRMAAERALEERQGLEIVYSFGEETYVSGHDIFFHDPNVRKIESGMRVGIDRTSPDQFLLTEYECEGVDVTFTDVNYMQLFEMLKSGELDAAVWNKDEGRVMTQLNHATFHSQKANELSKKVSEAALMIEKDQIETKHRIMQLGLQQTTDIQRKVEQGFMHPRY